MQWRKLPDGRSCLPAGTVIKFEQGGYYRILGEPVGYGGAGIIYPAARILRENDRWIEEPMQVALKECYPSVTGEVLSRSDDGAIGDAAYTDVYAHARRMMRTEKDVTGQIFRRGFRLTPVWAVMEEEEIAPDGEHFLPVRNSYALMERLDEKGVALGELLRAGADGCMTAYQSVCVVEQILQALREVHGAGYLHGDIQENNIFLKGETENGDEPGQVSLIDFGSARRLLEDGATEPIAGGELFSTRGYSAPECSFRPEEPLRLTKAADIYSVGYLLLRMLLGRAMDARALGLVVSGKYLFPRQAKKIGCPSGSLEAVNRILDRALQQNPADRYQSAEEMLTEIERLKVSLAPKKSAIASVDYEAFISYCHEPASMRAAERIQKKIERYRIPRAIQRQSGKKELGKVFRDRDELASSGDMEFHLKEALEHSEFLIVLLSPGVPQSPWVGREIELFLETHDREHVLTVIVEGEPGDVFPEILRKSEKYVASGTGRMQMQREPVESLAADIRAENLKEQKKKLKTEIYRLLAPMLGCSYDDLRQRQKEYRFRRTVRIMAAAMAVLAVTASYIGWQAFQIQKNYRETQAQRARYLSQVAEELFASGDQIGALQVALEALPDNEKDKSKPLVPEAEAAITRILYAYQDLYDRIPAFCSYRLLTMEAPARAAGMLSRDGMKYLTVDRTGDAYLWSTESGECLRRWTAAELSGMGAEGIVYYGAFLESDSVLLVSGQTILRLDPETGDCLWVKKQEGSTVSDADVRKCALSGDGRYLAVYDPGRFSEAPETERLFTPVVLYGTEDGEEVYQWRPQELNLSMSDSYVSDLCLSADGSCLAIAVHGLMAFEQEESRLTGEPGLAGEEENEGALLMLDWKADSLHIQSEKELGYQKVCFLDDERVVGAAHETFGLLKNDSEGNVPGGLRCCNARTGEILWKWDGGCQTGLKKTVELCPANAKIEGEEQPLLIFTDNRSQQVLDERTGKVLYQFSGEKEIAGSCLYDERHILTVQKNGNAKWISLLADGEYMQDTLHTNVTREVESILCDPRRSTLLLTGEQDCSVALTGFIEDEPDESVDLGKGAMLKQASVSDSGKYECLLTSSDGEERLRILDLESLQIKEPALDGIHPYELVCELGREDILYCLGTDEQWNRQLMAYDLASAEELWRLECDDESVRGRTDWLDADRIFSDGQGGEFLMAAERERLRFLDLRAGEWTDETIRAPGLVSNVKDSLSGETRQDSAEEYRYIVEAQITEDGRYILTTLGDQETIKEGDELRLGVYDRKSCEWKTLSGELDALRPVYKEGLANISIPDGSSAYTAAVYDQKNRRIALADLETGSIRQEIPFVGETNRLFRFLGQGQYLLLFGDDGYLKVWDTKEKRIADEDTELLSDVWRVVKYTEDCFGVYRQTRDNINFAEHVLRLYRLDGKGGLCPWAELPNGIDVEISNGITAPDGKLFSYVQRDGEFAIYHTLSLNELIAKAKEIVGDRELGEAEKTKYFIE